MIVGVVYLCFVFLLCQPARQESIGALALLCFTEVVDGRTDTCLLMIWVLLGTWELLMDQQPAPLWRACVNT